MYYYKRFELIIRNSDFLALGWIKQVVYYIKRNENIAYYNNSLCFIQTIFGFGVTLLLFDTK